MERSEYRGGVTGRARVAAWDRGKARVVPWWAWALVAAGVLAAMPSWGQASIQTSPVPDAGGTAQGVAPGSQVPEVVKPPLGGGVRSDNPQVGGGVRPVPDNGVIVPPPDVSGTTPVIRPPAAGTMPVIPPPGSAGGTPGVVPK